MAAVGGDRVSALEAPLDFPLGGGGETADDYTAMLAALLPPGKLWRLIPGASTLYALLQGCADELARLHDRATDMLNEADPTMATELLPEYERDFAIAAAPTIEERRANIAARRVRRQRFRPVDFRQVLAPLLVQAPADVVVIERSVAQAAALGDAREIRRFFIYRDPTLPGTAFIASAQALVDEMKRSTTAGHVIESIAFTCGDAHSIVGRDILKAP
jgi:hypothetical protein